MNILREYVRRVITEMTSDTYYHGRRGSAHFEEGKPAWFTTDRYGAKWYATERGSGVPTVYTARVSYVRAASYQTLKDVVENLALSKDAIDANSPYYGENENDYVYVPEVQRELESRGYDAFRGYDVLGNEEIPVLVVWHPSQIHVVDALPADKFESH